MRKRLHTTVLMAALASLGVSTGCARYAEVSPEAYQYSKALYSICNRKDKPRLTQVAEQIETARAAAELQETETGWLTEIVVTAQSGAWEDATQDARCLMEAQVVKN